MNNLVSTVEAQNGFYPTPKSVAYQLFDMIDSQYIHEVLEPSAGKGDLLKAFGCYKNEKYQESLAEKGVNKKDYNNASCNVDAIEFDPNLRGILNYEFLVSVFRNLTTRCMKLVRIAVISGKKMTMKV